MAVDTRKKPVTAMLVNQVIAAVVSFLLVLFAFKWLLNSSMGCSILYTALSLFYLSGIYSYAYSQAKIDRRDTGAYHLKNALTIGLWGSFWIGVVLIPHLLSMLLLPQIGGILAPVARFWNYPFSYFIYGLENDGTVHYISALFVLLLPVAFSFLAYCLSQKGFSATEKLYGLTHKKN